jgi:hypothetical protein
MRRDERFRLAVTIHLGARTRTKAERLAAGIATDIGLEIDVIEPHPTKELWIAEGLAEMTGSKETVVVDALRRVQAVTNGLQITGPAEQDDGWHLEGFAGRTNGVTRPGLEFLVFSLSPR